MSVRGDLRLEIDELAIEARVTITPDENGAEITPESLVALLREKGVREGQDNEAIEKAFRTLQRKRGQPVSFVAAAGTPPTPPEPDAVEFAPCAIPPRLQAVARELLAHAPAPEVYRERVEKVRTEKKVPRKQGLPFLHAKEEVQVVWEKKTVREKAEVDPIVRETGFVQKGALVATVRAGRPGREGRSILGRMVPAARGPAREHLFGAGLVRARDEVKADRAGFLRRGALWCDLVPFRDHRVELTASADKLTCLLGLEPGDAQAPLPDPAEILERAQSMGFEKSTLVAAAELNALIRRALLAGSPLAGVTISRRLEGLAEVAVSPDRLRATLTLQKGRGGGKPLALADISEAIRASGVKGFKAESVKKDILAFFTGPRVRLEEYPLATGREAETGADGRLEWLTAFLPAPEAAVVREKSIANEARLAALKSLPVFPLRSVEAVARVAPGAPIVKIAPARDGRPGVDVFGQVIPAPRGAETGIRLFEGLRRDGETVVAAAGGILEKGSEGMSVRLRVRPHRDATLAVSVAEDRMSASISFLPAEGTGASIGHEEVKAALARAGVIQGIDEGKLLSALDAVRKNSQLSRFIVAEGRRPAGQADRITVHVRMATGKSVAVGEDGRADFHTQDKITRVAKGTLLATVSAQQGLSRDGWDVTGQVVGAPQEADQTLAAGANVKAVDELDGSVRFFADRDGELVIDAGRVEVRQVHQIDKDVGLTTGNVKFPGTVRVGGSVLSGFAVVADGDIVVEDVVQAAFLSAGGSVEIGRGIKGEEKAVVRAKGSIVTTFAEQAALLAQGDVRIHGACLFCRLTCNGHLVLETEKGSVMGGIVRARQGIAAQNLGSPGGARTLVSFGQDYLLLEKIEGEQREIAKLKARIGELDASMKEMLRAARRDETALAAARAGKLAAMKGIEQRGLLLIGMRDRFDEHVPSEVVIRGTLYPGVIVESHGRRFSVQTEKSNLRLFFSKVEGKILEKI